MPDAPLLRDARLHDLPELLALEALFPGDRLSPRQMRHHLSVGRHVFRIVEDQTGLLGYALVFLRRGSRGARLYSLVVAPRARGRGLGALLLADAEDCVRQRGRSQLGLEVRADNTAAIALYRRAGYQELASRTGYYEDGETARRFWRQLGEP
jgi:ribosomal protein S18 acetylase RimI-like enzyme